MKMHPAGKTLILVPEKNGAYVRYMVRLMTLFSYCSSLGAIRCKESVRRAAEELALLRITVAPTPSTSFSSKPPKPTTSTAKEPEKVCTWFWAILQLFYA